MVAKKGMNLKSQLRATSIMKPRRTLRARRKLKPTPFVRATEASKFNRRLIGFWNFLLDCWTEGRNILLALLIVVPCEIKYRRKPCPKNQMF